MQALLLAFALLGQDSKHPEFVKFDVARERFGHKVNVDAELRNAGSSEMGEIRITAIYYDGDREVRRSKPVKVPKIGPGQTAAFRIEADQVQNFTRYELYLESAGPTRLYVGTDAAALPELKSAARASLAIVSQKLSPLTLVVRNSGGTGADEPTALLTFRGGTSAVVHQARVRLEKSIGALSEEAFEIAIPGVPAHASVDATVSWQASDEIALPDPRGDLRDVVLRQCSASRLNDGAARVSGTLSNRTAAPVRKVVARFKLGAAEVPHEFPGTLAAGASRPFAFYVPGVAPFDTVSFDLSFENASPADAAAEPPGLPSSRRTATKRVEGEIIKLPPPPARAADEIAGTNELRPPSVGIRGLLISEGAFGKNKKYSGDIYLMKMIFLDGRGKPYQPEATVQFVLYDGDKEVRRSKRSITKEGWGADASRLKGADIEFDTIALDRKANELWVGLHWSETPWAKPRADITVEVPNVGSYVFKDVRGDWAAAPRYPDSK